MVLEASGLHFGSILEGLGRILGGFWEGVASDFGGFRLILAYSGVFWAILGDCSVFGQSWEDFGWCCLLACLVGCLLAWLLLAAAQLEFKFKISSRVCLFYLSLALLSSL